MQTTVDIRELQERIERESSFIDALTMGMNQHLRNERQGGSEKQANRENGH